MNRTFGADTLETGITGTTASRITLVNSTIAVVIEAIADFRGGSLILHANQSTVLTVKCSILTYTLESGTAITAAARVAVIDYIVAVIIQTVTDLRHTGIHLIVVIVTVGRVAVSIMRVSRVAGIVAVIIIIRAVTGPATVNLHPAGTITVT
jgi:hypothetical protein